MEDFKNKKLVRVEKHSYLYYHIFSPEDPDGEYPEDSSRGPIVSIQDKFSSKLRTYEYLKKEKSNVQQYKYHGVFMKVDNFGRWHFKGICPEVEKAWQNAKAAEKFGI